MRLKISKPVAGLVNVELDDHRGITGMRKYAKGLEVGTLKTTIGALVKEWRDKRSAIIKAKKETVA